MAIFYGTKNEDTITEQGLSTGVTTDPAGLTATTDGPDIVYAFGGDDLVERRHRGRSTLWLLGERPPGRLVGERLPLGGDG